MFCVRCAFATFTLASALFAQNTVPTSPGGASQPNAHSQESANSVPAQSSAVPSDSTWLEPLVKLPASYPPAAQASMLQGQVVVKVVVSESGDVEKAELVSGPPELAHAALDAARNWKFRPFIKQGKPVKASANIPFDFHISGQVPDWRAEEPQDSTSGPPKRVQIPRSNASMLIRKVQPKYPQKAMRARLGGSVVLQALVGKNGKMRYLHVISGHPILAQAAMDAAKQWEYNPYFLNGEPVEVETEITVKFTMSNF